MGTIAYGCGCSITTPMSGMTEDPNFVFNITLCLRHNAHENIQPIVQSLADELVEAIRVEEQDD